MATEKDKKQAVPKQSDVFVLFGTIADTTWRMFIPIIGLMLLGSVVDDHFNMKPLGVIAGVIIGSVIAVKLVLHQLNSVKKKK